MVSNSRISLRSGVCHPLVIAGIAFLIGTAYSPTTGRCQTIHWKTGADFEKTLDVPVALTWKGNPLRNALTRLAESQKIAIFLDRRVDPSIKIDLVVQKMPVELVLRTIAERQRFGMAIVGPVVYLGPESTTNELATVAAVLSQQAKRLPVGIRSRFTRAKAWQWPELSEPSTVLQQIAQDASVEVQGIEHLPHDLWPSVQLPPLDFAHRMSIVLGGFQLSYQLDPQGKVMRLIPLPTGVVTEQRHDAGNRAKAVVASLRSKFPSSQLRVEGTKIVAKGPMRDQRTIARLLRGERVRSLPNSNTPSKQVFTLTVNGAPIYAILDKLSSQLGLKIRRAAGVEEKLKERVNFAVKDATLEQLLKAVLKDSGVDFKLQGKDLSLFVTDGS